MNRFILVFGLIIMLSFSGRAQFDVWLASLEKPSVSNKEKGFYADSLLIHYRKSNPDSALYFARRTQGRYDKAIKNYHEALEGFKKTENFNARGKLYSSFAGLYFKLENYQKAYDYWSLAEADFIRDGFSYEITHCYRGHARLYFEWNKLDQAEETLKKAIDLGHEKASLKFGELCK